MLKKIVVVLFCICVNAVFSQSTGKVKGKIIDSKTRESLPFVNVIVDGTAIGSTSNEVGVFEINNVPLGYIKIKASFIGFMSVVSSDYLVTKEKVPFINLEMIQNTESLDEILVEAALFKRSVESPLSKQSLGLAEIEKNPGGNRDILKVIQSLPGVASNPGFRNDIIIRGGSPVENKFYLDGIEVPVINHFQTQGSTGGPVGIINADLIRNVDFYTSSFQANKGNALSSIIEFTQKEGNPTKLNTRATIGTSDAGITLDGPLGDKTTFIASVRQSYLQVLFKLIKLPFLPTYNDFQFNVKHKIDDSNEISIIGLGAIDNFKLNTAVNNSITDEDDLKRNNYILSNIPVQEQWNYTVGASYKHFSNNSVQQVVLSRNEWGNNAKKYFNNTDNAADLLLNYSSKEIENKLRVENTATLANNYKLNIGAGMEQATYTNETFQKRVNTTEVSIIDFDSKLNLMKYAFFGQLTKTYLNSKLGASLGFRMDAVNYSDAMKNPLNQFSPRFSASYELSDKLTANISVGSYYQLPTYTILGFRDEFNNLVNKENELKYMQSTHYVSGFELKPSKSVKMSLEGFYKKYSNYPFSVNDQISLANLGSDFGVVGNEEVESSSKGRAYGIEFLAQKKSFDGLYGILSYTYVISEFQDKNNNYIPSSWDNKHLLTITGGKKWRKNWEIGGKFRLVGGSPYTPYDYDASSIIENYNIANQGILNYEALNANRYDLYHQFDVRIDKTWYWDRFSLNFYIDIQNVYASDSPQTSYLTPSVDGAGNRVINASDSSKYVLEEIDNTSGNVLPRFGFIFDF